MNRCLILCLMLVYIKCVFAQNEIIPEIDRKCLDCICQASSNCDSKVKCHNSGGGGYYCGPYIISWAYWADGGKPGDKGGQKDFENCANDKKCAEEAVRGYMQRYGRDCDKSRTIDCYDFARIHKMGFGACADESFYESDFYEKFESCYND